MTYIMKSLYLKIFAFTAIFCTAVYIYGNKQILAKHINSNRPSIDFHFSYQNLYVGFDIKNASKYRQIEYQIKYEYNGNITRVIEGKIDNSASNDSFNKEKILLGSASTGGTESFDNVTSPITLTVSFDKSPNKYKSVYEISEFLYVNK